MENVLRGSVAVRVLRGGVVVRGVKTIVQSLNPFSRKHNARVRPDKSFPLAISWVSDSAIFRTIERICVNTVLGWDGAQMRHRLQWVFPALESWQLFRLGGCALLAAGIAYFAIQPDSLLRGSFVSSFVWGLFLVMVTTLILGARRLSTAWETSRYK
jgi:hypothetical protein